jgi:FAD/FMN-containing dehydrogenase
MSTPRHTPISSGRFAAGGGNLGVATSFTYRLHPLQTIVGGLTAHPLDAAPDLLRVYRKVRGVSTVRMTVPAFEHRAIRILSSIASSSPRRRQLT